MINKDVYVRYRNLYKTILREAKSQYNNNFFLVNKKMLELSGSK